MKPIRRNDTNFFPQGIKNVWVLLLDYYFQPLKSPHVYRVTKKDFGTRTITGINIEDPADIITLDFKTPVTYLKKF